MSAREQLLLSHANFTPYELEQLNVDTDTDGLMPFSNHENIDYNEIPTDVRVCDDINVFLLASPKSVFHGECKSRSTPRFFKFFNLIN